VQQLTPEEAALAHEILSQAYQDLREEIYKTENTDFRAGLKRREDMLAFPWPAPAGLDGACYHTDWSVFAAGAELTTW
jgi:hypothetical protein